MKLSPLILLVPLCLFVIVLWGRQSEQPDTISVSPQARQAVLQKGRLVLIIVDSMPLAAERDPRLMPELSTLSHRPDARWVTVHTCSGNFTLPCMQTLLEGRESPFAAGLHNFTGQQGALASLPGLAHALGLPIAIVSDHTLTSLYGQYAVSSVDSNQWPPDYLARDRRAIQAGLSALAKPEIRVLLLHVLGTDKAAHYYKPTSARYIKHYQQVSRDLDQLFRRLNLQQDSLIVTGDHGHDANGDHARESPALFVGARFAEFFSALSRPPARIEQRDVLYLMSVSLSLPLPPGYEGAFFPADQRQERQLVKAYEALQIAELARQGYTQGSTLAHKAAQVHHHLSRRHLDDLLTYLPLVLCYLAFLILWPAIRRWSGLRQLAALAGFAGGALLLGRISSSQSGLYLSLPALALLLVPIWRAAQRRRALFFYALIIGAALLSYGAKDWSRFFHISNGFRWVYPFFFIMLFGVGALLAYIGERRWSALPWGTLAFCFFCLPSGPYYYQSGTNMIQGFVAASALLVILRYIHQPAQLRHLWPELRSSKQWRWLLLLLLAIPFLFLQDAGGWEWGAFLYRYLQTLGPYLSFVIYYLLGLALSLSLPRWWARGAVLSCWILAHLYSVVLAKMPYEQLIAAQAPFLFLIGFLALALPARTLSLDEPPLHNNGIDKEALLLLAALGAAEWFIFSGFTLSNMDFSFAFDYFHGVRSELHLFLLCFAATCLKYGMPFLAILLYLALRYGAQRLVWMSEGFYYWIHVKMALLLLQNLVGALGSEEKLYELAIGDFLFISCLYLVFCAAYLWLWATWSARQLWRQWVAPAVRSRPRAG